jgi:hypothetical protein
MAAADDVRGLRTLLALLHVEGHGLALDELAVAVAADHRVVGEHVSVRRQHRGDRGAHRGGPAADGPQPAADDEAAASGRDGAAMVLVPLPELKPVPDGVLL